MPVNFEALRVGSGTRRKEVSEISLEVEKVILELLI